MNKVQPRADLRNLEKLARLMDAQFRIPGTSIRFGFDGIIGLIPGVGDIVGLLISGYMLSEASKKGVSGYVMARMLLNTGIDFVIGSIPFLGDIFDFAFKANQRNMRLLQEHFKEGRHRGSAARVVVPFVIVMLIFLVGLIWVFYKLIVWIF
jgi:hypothetical protein